MSSESDDEDFVSYGTPLEPLDEDTIPKKKAITIEEQVAKDKHGRRRFHGAFTGGFSAGFFNSVGSLEGWKPSQFKSSRSLKSKSQVQRPEDFMDDEDMDEFGIAPKVLRPKGDYRSEEGSSRKRQLPVFSDGPIPGTPVLRSLIEPVRETIGIRLLKRMGWKPGQGVGPRLSKSEKLASKKSVNQVKIYGCALPNEETLRIEAPDDSEDDDEIDLDVTFAPDDFDPWIVKPKEDSYGLGYSGLDRRPILSSHIDLFGPPTSSLVMKEKKKKVNIRGQAFGVGAFEREDEDIYATEDMSQYDFALDTPQMLAEKRQQERNKQRTSAARYGSSDVLEGFVLSSTPLVRKSYPPPPLPPGFTPQHVVKPSRFSSPKVPDKVAGKRLTAAERAVLVNEPEVSSTPVQAQTLPEVERTTTSFRPFVADPEKQERYEKYLTLSKQGQTDKLKDLQPFKMTEWERERERVEFDQAARLYRPLSAAFSDRFVRASVADDATDPMVPVARTTDADQDVKGAAKLKMFGKLTRRITDWSPHNTLCKRFNIPPPRGGGPSLQAKSSRPKFSVFNFLDAAPFNQPASALGFSPEKSSKQNDPEEKTQETSHKIETPMEVSYDQVSSEKNEQSLLSSKDDELEKLADSTSKMDLYKAIFLSSSDESDDEGDAKPSTSHQTPTLSEQNVLRNTSPPRGIFANLDFDKINNPKPKSSNQNTQDKSEVNVRRNTSPPRGIFANLDSLKKPCDSKINESTEVKNQAENCKNVTGIFGSSNQQTPGTANKSSVECDTDVYGPVLPTTPVIVKKTVVVDVDSASDSEGDWVEMNESSDSDKSRKQSSKKKHSKKSHRSKKSKKHKEKKHKHKKKSKR